MSNTLILNTTTIKTDSDGRFCLNDLHKAAGGADKHKPVHFMKLTSTWELIREVEETVGNPTFSTVTTTPGRNGGTYVRKELVYAYAMWISPAFHLKVIRFFDRGVTDGVAVSEHAAEDLLNDPLSFMEKVMAQAKRLKAERDAIQAKLVVAEPKALVFDTSMGGKEMSVSRLPYRLSAGAGCMKGAPSPWSPRAKTSFMQGVEAQSHYTPRHGGLRHSTA